MHVCISFGNDPLIFVASDCLWTVYNDGSFDYLVVVCVIIAHNN